MKIHYQQIIAAVIVFFASICLIYIELEAEYLTVFTASVESQCSLRNNYALGCFQLRYLQMIVVHC